MNLFEDALERVRRRFLFAVAGYVVMPEHMHLLVNRHYQTGVPGTVEIESEWTARKRGWQLPDWMRDPLLVRSPSPVPKCEGPGAPSTGGAS